MAILTPEQSQRQLYFPSSFSVTLKIVTMNSFLHMVLVPYSCISYFLVVPCSRLQSSFKSHFIPPVFAQSVYGSTSTTHCKLRLEEVDTGKLEEEEILVRTCPEDQEPG